MVGELGVPYFDFGGSMPRHGLCITSSHPLVQKIPNDTAKGSPLPNAFFGSCIANTWANRHGECSNGVGVVAVVITWSNVRSLVMGTSLAVAVHA